MPARASKPLTIGQTFESWKELQDSITDHGIQAECTTSTYKKDATRQIVKCRRADVGPAYCKWYLRALKGARSETITVKALTLLHTCEGADHYKRRMHSRSSRLADQIFDIVQTNRCTKPKFLRDTLKATVHPDVQYYSAHAAFKTAIYRLDGKEKDTFYLIPPHCHHILQRDPGAVARWAAPDGNFSNLFVCPSSSRDAFQHCRPLVALDAAHTLSTYPMTLYLATALDANQTIIILAYGLAPSKNPEEWDRFLKLLREAIPKLEQANMVFVSDREKGLLDGIDDIFPRGHHCYCIWHMGQNIKKKFGEDVRKKFDGLVYAGSIEQYNRRFERLKDEDPEAAHYIKHTAHPRHYSRAFCPTRRCLPFLPTASYIFGLNMLEK